MATTDTFGGITLPIPAPTAGQPVSDPFLYYATAYLQAVVNAKGTAAWQAVKPGGLPISTVFTHDPEQVVFNERTLPALYMWREGSTKTPEWIGEDILVQYDRIRILWVFPNDQQANRRIREPIVNGLVKLIIYAIEIGRDPAWVVPGDTYADAATAGSILWRYAPLVAINFTSWKRGALIIPMLDSRPKTYESVEMTAELSEDFAVGEDRFDPLLGLDLTETTGDGAVDTEHDVFT